MDEVLEQLKRFKEQQISENEGQIVDIIYYGTINLSKNDKDLSNQRQENLYLVEKEVNGRKELQFYTDSSVIATVQENGEIVISDKYKELINTNEFLLQMQKVKPLSLQKLEQIHDKNQEQDISSKTTQTTSKEENKNIYDENAKDVRIDMNKKITETKTFADLVPEVKQKGIKDVVVRRIDGANFEFIGLNENNEMIQLETLRQTEGTNPNIDVIEVNQDGSKVEKDKVLTMLKIRTGENQGREDEGFTVSLGDYGIPEVNYYRRASQLDEYTSIPVNLENTNQKRTELEVREYMEKKRNTDIDDNIERANDRIQQNENEETVLENIDDNFNNDIITEELEILIQKAADRCKISIEAFKEQLEKVDGETLEEKIENAEEEINEQFRGNSDRRR